MFHICAQEVPYGTLAAPSSARFSLDASPGLYYYTAMDNTPDCTSDLPDSFDPAWEEDIECDEFYDGEYAQDSAWWESAYGPADDGGYSF